MADPLPLAAGMHPLDAMAQAADHHGVLLENDKVRFLDTRVAPGARTAVHAHQWPAALYVLSWSDFVRYDAAGNVLLDSRNLARRPEPGEALWAPPIGPHFLHNVGTTDLRILAIEVKG
jgi:quercetin dioxygenase-like cupin family protein